MNAGDDPETASQIWTSPRYNDAALKYTSAVNSQLLVDAGYSFNYEEYVITNQDGINKTAFSPRVVRRRQPARPDAGDAAQRPRQLGRPLSRSVQHAGVGVVRHRLAQRQGRLPVQLGPYINTRETNADLQQVYTNGVPSSVTIYNTPLRYKEALLGDLGIYAQDTWTINRLTLNGGLRWEYLKHEVSKQESGAGRFIGERNFDADPDADLEGHRAALRRGLRPVRQRQDGAEVRPQPLQRIAHDVLRQPLQPAGA